ncbi:MAG: hypothetical protein SF162_15845 [bacterium]|nr:hypothetical protein [bacterium]
MKFRSYMLGLLMAVLFIPALSQAQQGVSVTCDNGATFDNGIEVIINQMRSGFTYTATAVGLNGFDPVLAVLGENGEGLCSDDDSAGASYEFDLPTTGGVAASNLSAQVRFSQNSAESFADISLVVGGFGAATGEFVLILEGMAVTDADGQGDPFSLRLTPEMVASGVPLTVYMLGREGNVDPLMYRIDGDRNPLEDSSGGIIGCDDGGDTNRCWGQSVSLDGAGVATNNGIVRGESLDAMLSFDLNGLALSSDADQNFFNFVMTSYEQATFGQYLLAFHIGTAPADSAPAQQSTNNQSAFGNTETSGTDKGGFVDGSGGGTDSNQAPNTSNASLSPGVAVDCDGGVSFTNGVEIRVIQMRSGFNYTATAIGLNGFDPVLAVLGESGDGLCSDDDDIAARYELDLPTTGGVAGSNLSSRVTFANNSSGTFADISLVVGGFGDATGEFVLILEGMGVTDGDGAGDPFALRVTPGMTFSDVPLSVYMIARTNQLDPYMYQVVNDEIYVDADGTPVLCDDAGDSSRCYAPSENLSGSFIETAEGRVNGGDFDAMLVRSVSGVPLNEDANSNFLRFNFTSFDQATFGQYLLAFHIGTAAP